MGRQRHTAACAAAATSNPPSSRSSTSSCGSAVAAAAPTATVVDGLKQGVERVVLEGQLGELQLLRFQGAGGRRFLGLSFFGKGHVFGVQVSGAATHLEGN